MNKLLCLLTILSLSYTSYALSMKDYLEQAIKKHPNIEYMRQTTKSIEGDIGLASSDYYPNIYARGAAGLEGHNYNNGASKDGTTTEAEIGLRYDIFDGQKRKFNKQTELFRKSSADYKIEEAVNSFTLDAVRAYIEVLKQRELVKISEEVLTRHKRFLDKIKLKFDKGLGRLSELKKSRVDVYYLQP